MRRPPLATREALRNLTQPVAFAIVLATVGWLMPVFGVSLLAFVLVDAAWSALARRRTA